MMRKPDDERQRRNAHIYTKRQLQWDGKTRGPSLPDEVAWSDLTLRWWEDLRNSPNVMHARDTDWDNLMMAALIYDRLWTFKFNTGSEMTSLSAELRRRLAPYGYTYEDRLKYNIEITSDEIVDEEIKREVEQFVDYQKLLGDAMAKEKKNGNSVAPPDVP